MPGGGLAGPLRLTFYTLLALATAQQQLPRQGGFRGSPPENAALRQLTQSAKNNNNDHTRDVHTPTGRKGKSIDHAAKHHSIISTTKDERAVATVAPAGQTGTAVRAPSALFAAGTASAGLTNLRARRLQDWEVEDIVLLATVEGSIYAVGRSTGKELWSFHSDRPVVEITYAKDRFKDYDERATEEDILWVVEPSNGGSIYIFVPGEGGGVQKWDMTVKKLADDLSPYEDPNMPFVYTAEKRNTLYTLNATSGDALKYFSSGGSGIMDQKSCRKVDNMFLDEDDNECEQTPTLNLGRAEYTVNIASQRTGQTVCTIKYFEWTSNKRDDDLVGQYVDTIDNLYFYPRSDGQIWAIENDRSQARGKSTQKSRFLTDFTVSPVVRAFDVVKPQGADTRETPLVILPQPIAPVINNKTMDHVFLGSTNGGSFYAMSEMTYPSVTEGAKEAKCYNDFRLLEDFEGEPTRRQTLTPSSLVGIHTMNGILHRNPHLPSIAGPEPETENEHAREIDASEPVTVPLTNESREPLLIDYKRPAYDEYHPLISMQDLINCIVILFTAYFVAQYFAPKQVPQLWSYAKQWRSGKPIYNDAHALKITAPTNVTEVIEPAAAERKQVRFPDDIVDDSDLPVQGPCLEDGTAPTLLKKKKAHRGSRGGRKDRASVVKNRLKRQESREAEGHEATDRVAEDVMLPEQGMQPDAASSNARPGDVSDSLAIQSIKVDTDRVLGYGSGGTTVYEGTFEGREVAVKRMLLQYYDLASQEIKLLSQSDDHPNVVRYYRHEKDKDFL